MVNTLEEGESSERVQNTGYIKAKFALESNSGVPFKTNFGAVAFKIFLLKEDVFF